MLQRILYTDICRRTGSELSEKQAVRLINTVKHYMVEVESANPGKQADFLNKEVLRITIDDYMRYLERDSRKSRSAVKDISAGPPATSVGQPSSMVAIEDVRESRTQMDVANAFQQLQNQRMESKKPAPVPRDFRVPLDDEGPVSMDVFQRIKEEREAEAARANSLLQAQAQSQGQQKFANATGAYSDEKRKAEQRAEDEFAEIERRRLESRMNQQLQQAPLPIQGDMRALMFGDRQTIDRNQNTEYTSITPYFSMTPTYTPPPANANAGNSTLATPSAIRGPSGGLQQLIIQPEPATMAYKETELNLFVYSGDRDWVNNTTETRYNFSVIFDAGASSGSASMNSASIAKFRNITRCEFVKAILPGEGLDLLVTKSTSNAYDSSLSVNVLSFPYIQVRVPELDNNTYGTNQSLNACFGVLQYDANWISDTGNSVAHGYYAMIPKFLKAQKVYTPTPLATFQKLSFRFERPDGTLLSTAPDTLSITRIIPTLAMNATNFATGGALTNTIYKEDTAVDISGSSYYWLQTSTYFNHWTVTKGDRIKISSLTFATDPTGNTLTQATDLANFLTQDAGLQVVGTGVITGTGTNAIFADNYNKQGYANAIIVRGRFIDPALTGGLLPASPGGIVDQYSSGFLSYFLVNTNVTKGRILNLSHQVQVVLRVIVREVDPTGIIRPDNVV